MSYESKLYIVDKKDMLKGEEKRYSKVIAMFDLCKCSYVSNVLSQQKETDCYFYGDDGDVKMIKDKYGKPLTESTVEFVIDLLEEVVANGEDYRRIFPLLSMLQTIDEQQKDGIWEEVVVVHYGY